MIVSVQVLGCLVWAEEGALHGVSVGKTDGGHPRAGVVRPQLMLPRPVLDVQLRRLAHVVHDARPLARLLLRLLQYR